MTKIPAARVYDTIELSNGDYAVRVPRSTAKYFTTTVGTRAEAERTAAVWSITEHYEQAVALFHQAQDAGVLPADIDLGDLLA